MTVTVLCLEPAFFPVMKTWMKDYATTGDRFYEKVRYPNIPNARNAAAGVRALDEALHRSTGQVVVFGHSMGAQVAAKWLREKGPSSTVAVSRVRFLLAGNPERKYGGALCVPSTPKLWGVYTVRASYGGPGVPDDTPYTVIDYARQYDWWADHPTVPNPSKEALRNASMEIHCDYWNVGLDDPDVLSYTEGTRTYLLKPTARALEVLYAVEPSYVRPMC